MSILEIKNITKYYKRNKAYFKVIDNLSLTVETGDFCQIIGRSGSGKSSLLNLIANLLQVDDGEIYFNSVCVNSASSDKEFVISEVSSTSKILPNANKNKSNYNKYCSGEFKIPSGMSYMPQQFKLLPNLNVWQNIKLVYDMASNKEDIFSNISNFVEYAKYLIDEANLAHLLYSYPSTLSGGELKRVQLVRALILKPVLLLCDEPLSDLDSISRTEVMKLLKTVNEFTTIIMVTHDLDYLNNTNCYTMCDGNLVKGVNLV